jgi:protein TonB
MILAKGGVIMIEGNTCTGIFIHDKSSEDRGICIKRFLFNSPLVILMAIAVNGLFLVGLSIVNDTDIFQPPPPPPDTWMLTPYHPPEPVPIVKPEPETPLPPGPTRSPLVKATPDYRIETFPDSIMDNLPDSMPVYRELPRAALPPVTTPGIFDIGEVDKQPQLIRHVPPIYPFSAKRKNIEGQVTVRFIVDKTGMVLDPFVIEATPEGVFEDAALKAVAKWRFNPAVLDKKPVDVYVVVPLVFELK